MGPQIQTGAITQACLTPGAGSKLGSHGQEPLLLREFRGMKFRKKKGGKGTRAGAGSGVGGSAGNNTVGRTKYLKKAGLEHGGRQD